MIPKFIFKKVEIIQNLALPPQTWLHGPVLSPSPSGRSQSNEGVDQYRIKGPDFLINRC